MLTLPVTSMMQTGVRDLRQFLSAPPLQLPLRRVDIKARVEDYLQATFYNLSAVALHDVKVKKLGTLSLSLYRRSELLGDQESSYCSNLVGELDSHTP